MKKHNQEIFYCSVSEFSDVAAEEIKNKILLLLTEKKKINIALSGGSTPIPILNKLKKESINWKQVSFFLVDERCVPLDSAESNFGVIKRTFFDFILSSSYSMYDGLKTAEHAAKEYEDLIKKVVPLNGLGIPVFDLMVLGMGDDGHIASLFPETSALHENQRMVVHNEVPKLKATRISFTYPLIMTANHRIMLIKGESKIKILNELQNFESTNYPISKIFSDSNMRWIVGK